MIESFGKITGRLSALFARRLVLTLGLLFVVGALEPNVASARSHGYAYTARHAQSWTYARPRPVFRTARARAPLRYARPRGTFVYSPQHLRYAQPRAVFRYAHRRAIARFARARTGFQNPKAQAAVASGVITEASRYIGAGNVTGMRGPWCADYASMVLRHTGRRPLASRNAASALAYGPRVGQPRPGDLVVVGARSGYAAHVGFFAGWDGGRVVIVSGNWGHRVARASIAPRAVVAFIGV